jgi:hypothetical protein
LQYATQPWCGRLVVAFADCEATDDRRGEVSTKGELVERTVDNLIFRIKTSDI